MVADRMCDGTPRPACPADRRREGSRRHLEGNGARPVLHHEERAPIESRNLNRSFETRCVRTGIRKVRFHDLHHTCASLLHEQRTDARMITEVLGHSSIRMAMDIYTFVPARLPALRFRPGRGRTEG
ncbi:tyrosine-type recombinase/integrase [Streptomyces sp. NPDC059080]|uniref:tyrosine-type recombinase/integrase n=1 Tax=Streptomyces sp. NPDC059080 TaxID=3346718 RepID=UPI00368CE74F